MEPTAIDQIFHYVDKGGVWVLCAVAIYYLWTALQKSQVGRIQDLNERSKREGETNLAMERLAVSQQGLNEVLSRDISALGQKILDLKQDIQTMRRSTDERN